MLHSHPLLIPDDIVQHITPDSLVFLNKHDLISGYASEEHVTSVREQVLGLTKRVWVGSVLKSESGGMKDFVEGLVEALRQRWASFCVQTSSNSSRTTDGILYSTALAEGQTGDAIPLITRARHREHLEQSLLHIEKFLSLGAVVLYLSSRAD